MDLEWTHVKGLMSDTAAALTQILKTPQDRRAESFSGFEASLPPLESLPPKTLTLLKQHGIEHLADGDLPGLVFDPVSRTVWGQGVIKASFGRSKLLYRLLEAIADPNVVGRQEIYTRVWKFPYRGEHSDNVFHVALNRLRKKLQTSLVLEANNGRYCLAGRPRIWRLCKTAPPRPGWRMAPPAPSGGFIGRRADLELLDASLNGKERVVVLKGPVGVGKTRLALEWIQRHKTTRNPAYIDTAGMTPERLLSKLEDGVGIAHKTASDQARTKAIAQSIQDLGPITVVLDSLEHLLGAVGPWIQAWALAAPESRWLCISQRDPGSRRARLVQLAPLAPEDAVEMLEKALEPRPSIAQVSALAKVCDGLPQALEIAAAQARALPIQTLLDRDDLRAILLDAKDPWDNGRGESLRGRFEQSWALLSPLVQDAAERLSAFESAFSPHSAEALLSGLDSPTHLLRLLTQASVIHKEQGDSGKLAMPTLMRAFARRRLKARGAPFDRNRAAHAQHTLAQSEVLAISLRITGSPDMLGALQAWRPELRAVLLGSAHDPESCVRAALCLDALMTLEGPHIERVALLEQAAAQAQHPSVPQRWRHESKILFGRALMDVGRFEDAHQSFDEAENDTLDTATRALLARSRGNLAWRLTHTGEALKHFLNARELYLACGEVAMATLVLGNIGVSHCRLSEELEAEKALRSALAGHRRLGNVRSEAVVLANLAVLSMKQRRYIEAAEQLLRSVDIQRTLGNRASTGIGLATLGVLRSMEGRLADAERHLREAREIFVAVNRPDSQATASMNLAAALITQDRVKEARALLDEAQVVAEPLGNPTILGSVLLYQAFLEASSGRLNVATDFLDRATVLFEGQTGPCTRWCRLVTAFVTAQHSPQKAWDILAPGDTEEDSVYFHLVRTALSRLRNDPRALDPAPTARATIISLPRRADDAS